MKLVLGRRQSGKTRTLIEMADRDGLYIICPTQDDCSRVFREACGMGRDILFPISFSEFVEGRFFAKGVTGFLFDDLHRSLSMWAKGVPIFAASIFTDELEGISDE